MKAIHRFVATLALTLAAGAPAVHAQVGIYGKFDYNHFTNAASNTSANLVGGGVGVYDDFLHLGPAHLGADLRGDYQTGDKLHYRSLLAGVRVSGHVPFIPLRPYGQASVGFGGSETQGPYAAGVSGGVYDRKLLYAFFGGLDTTIFPHLDFRAIDVGVGRQSTSSNQNTSVKSTLVLVSSGLVVRF